MKIIESYEMLLSGLITKEELDSIHCSSDFNNITMIDYLEFIAVMYTLNKRMGKKK